MCKSRTALYDITTIAAVRKIAQDWLADGRIVEILVAFLQGCSVNCGLASLIFGISASLKADNQVQYRCN